MRIDLYISRLKKFGKILISPSLLWIFLRYGVFAGVEHKAVIRSSLKCIVDIGANKGQFALACRLWAPDAQIYSFEPLLGPARIFKSIFSKNENIKLFEIAIGSNAGSAVFHLSAREDCSSLLPIGANQEKKFPGTYEVGSLNVEVTPLAKLLNIQDIVSPAMLKLDVQGYEMKVLEGCENLLSEFEYVYCECSFIELYCGQSLVGEIVCWLQERQFNLVGVFNLNYDHEGDCVQGDFLFQRSLVE